ncbi:hypothetical protein PVAND_003280 [Polypedilum vanderplanki]|uniref:CHK kinase-like domain-containing protein n=1 Tax=Polypedilum vanderplanki TaxID=319348 RepID=A0A9J6BU32_POLVA|nr:hypothetical protein PVAND_003280 [Polypedilum vanderplanki]
MSEQQKKLYFIENVLPKLIIERNEELRNHSVVECNAKANSQLDGFMAAIYSVDLVLKNLDGRIENHKLIAKIMKGDNEFREKTNSSVQCSNEIYIYKNVIPYFKSLLKNIQITSFNPDHWVPRIYYADYKVFPELSEEQEAVLALENLTPHGYRTGPRIDLDENHLKLMVTSIASYHAVSYAMEINKDPMIEKFRSELTPLYFISPEGKDLESYNILFKIGLERIFTIVENRKEFHTNVDFIETVKKIKDQMFDRPVTVMQKFLAIDEHFRVFLHGDYNRNNVLFRYEQSEGFDDPKELRMIDYQETRYGTPVIDLAFFMYMNMPANIRNQCWEKLLDLYHETFMNCLIDILKCDNNDPRLEPFKREKFLEHFAKHAFYGCMVIWHFIPWIDIPDDECAKIAHLFETDMKSDELRQLLQVSGGSKVDDRLLSVLQHAYEKGYLKIFD